MFLQDIRAKKPFTQLRLGLKLVRILSEFILVKNLQLRLNLYTAFRVIFLWPIQVYKGCSQSETRIGRDDRSKGERIIYVLKGTHS